MTPWFVIQQFKEPLVAALLADTLIVLITLFSF